MSDDGYQAGFKAFQSEWEAESAYLVWPEGAKAAFLRVFNDKGGLIRIDLQIARGEDGDSKRPEHVQVVVGQAELMRRLAEPQEIPGEA